MAKYYSTALLVVTLLACNAAPAGNFARNSARFSLNLYKAIASGASGNVVFSPFSVQTALALAYMGADGDTAAEMAQGLHFERDVNVVANNHKSLFDHHAEHGSVKIANKIFLANGFDVKPTFMQLATEKLYSAAENIDTSNGARAAQTINSWVEGQTNDKIKNLVQASDVQDSASVLVNAVHFKADWMLKFKKSDTRNKPFWLSASQNKDVEMMSQESTFGYSEFEDFKALRLLYKDTDLSLLVILPNEREGLSQVEPRFWEQEADIVALLHQLKMTRVHVELPKFKTEFEAKLKPALTQLGMGTMFTPNADFSKLTSRRIAVGNVIHKAVIEVDEKGTEAAAATAVVMVLTASLPPPPPQKHFVADHPFLYLLLDSNGHIFFMGRYVK